jgi:hypothetical protein
MMDGRHRLVVSAENGAFHAWQCKLFYFSCITRLQHQPIFIVHSDGRPWHPDFCDLIRAGAILRTVPSYISENGIPSRNFPGTLIEVAPLLGSGQIIVLCDPDLVFVGRPELPAELAASHYYFLNYDRPSIHTTARKLGISAKALRHRRHELVCGTPYIIPIEVAEKVGQTWLKAFDAFPDSNRDGDNVWLDLMYAFGLAVLKLDLPIQLLDAVNLDSPSGCMLTRKVIHYGVGDSDWDKRWYRTETAAPAVWDPPFAPCEGTVLAELFAQILSASRFYGDPFGLRSGQQLSSMTLHPAKGNRPAEPGQ